MEEIYTESQLEMDMKFNSRPSRPQDLKKIKDMEYTIITQEE